VTDSEKPLSTFADRRFSRRRLLAIGATAPAAAMAAKALPGRISTFAPPQPRPATSAQGAASTLASVPAGPAYWFC